MADRLARCRLRGDAVYGDAVFRAGFHALSAYLSPNAAHGDPAQLWIKLLRFRTVAPGTAQRTALQEDCGADPRTILNGKRLNVKYFSCILLVQHMISPYINTYEESGARISKDFLVELSYLI